MKLFSQKDVRWAGRFIGNTRLTIGSYGCLIVSLAMLTEKRPDDMNATLTRGHCFGAEGKLDCSLAAKTLGLTYGKSPTDPKSPPTDPCLLCIAETDHFAKDGYPQHFFCYLGGYIGDPLSGRIIRNPYHIVSYRVFGGIPT